MIYFPNIPGWRNGRRGRFKTYSSGEGSSPSLGTWVVYSFPETVLYTTGKMWTLPFRSYQMA